MICLYDGNVYTITPEDLQTLDSDEMFQFFRDGHEEDIFAIYNANKQYIGAITYDSLLSGLDLFGAITDEKLVLNERFWDQAQVLLKGKNQKVIPVFNQNMEMLYLARYKGELEQAWKKLRVLNTIDTQISAFWVSSHYFGKNFHITGCNIVLYYFREWLLCQGINVSVSGEQWKLFGIQEESYCDSETVLVDEECKEIEYLHDEYIYKLRAERAKIEKIFTKEFVGDLEAEDKIMFWVPDIRCIIPMFNIMSLVLKYLKEGKNCIFVMPPRENFLQCGSHYMKNAIEFMEQVQEAGGDICSCDELEKICKGRYSVCYTTIINCVTFLPEILHKKIDAMVVVQHWAFFMHYYYRYNPMDNDTFENAFTDKIRNEVDYYVASDFMADWICRQDERWKGKMLRFGYPRQDLLYRYVHGERDIPKEWIEKTGGKKVFLFTEMEESWLDHLLGEGNYVIIFRPHPGYLNKYRGMFRQLEKMSGGKIILDDRSSYNASFYLADAMITEPLCSVGISFLSMGKPVLLRSDVVDETNMRIDFRQEDWYKASYIGAGDQDIFDFMDMVCRGEDVRKEELEKYRSRMVGDFDGKVSERIYNYFENNEK